MTDTEAMRTPTPIPTRTDVVLVTGLSGAGRTSCLKTLEDAGYEAIDNLPLSLLPSLLTGLDEADAPDHRRIVVGLDTRTRDFATDRFLTELERLRSRTDATTRVVFMDCDDDVLIRRFTETRRRHPLAVDRPIADGIRVERSLMWRIRERAEIVIDSSTTSVATFREDLSRRLGLDREAGMSVSVVSFAFRHGLPRDADMVFDVRFLSNPHYVPELRDQDGRDPGVAAHVSADPMFEAFLGHITGMVAPLLPRFVGEGKSYLTIAVGCTGGRHRSVYTAERLCGWLRAQGTPVTLRHRDVDRPAPGL